METYDIKWNGIEINIQYNPSFSEAYRKQMGRSLAHIEIRSNSVLPVTETGYRSHFTGGECIEKYGGAIGFVVAWLNDAAQSKSWKIKAEESRQLTLF